MKFARRRVRFSPARSKIENRQSKILLGAHMSIRGGVHTAIERPRSINCTAMQMFVKNNMQWFRRPFVKEEIPAFLDNAQHSDLASLFAHPTYLTNLPAPNPQFH